MIPLCRMISNTLSSNAHWVSREAYTGNLLQVELLEPFTLWQIEQMHAKHREKQEDGSAREASLCRLSDRTPHDRNGRPISAGTTGAAARTTHSSAYEP